MMLKLGNQEVGTKNNEGYKLPLTLYKKPKGTNLL